MLLSILLAGSFRPAQQASTHCVDTGAETAASQTQLLHGQGGVTAVLKVPTADGHSKNSHHCTLNTNSLSFLPGWVPLYSSTFLHPTPSTTESCPPFGWFLHRMANESPESFPKYANVLPVCCPLFRFRGHASSRASARVIEKFGLDCGENREG